MSPNAGIEAQRAKAMMVYRETVAEGLSVEMDLKRVLASTESDFQKIDVIDTYFGKVRRTSYRFEWSGSVMLSWCW